MAQFTVNLFNSLAPKGKRVIITGILEQVDFQETRDGEVVWVLRLETNANASDGNPVTPIYITDLSLDNLDLELRNAISQVASQIDWGQVEDDSLPPYIADIFPFPGQESVPISSFIKVKLKDAFPSTAIDSSTIKMKVNGIDVTQELNLVGSGTEYIVNWYPKVI